MMTVQLAEARIPELGEEVGIVLDGVPWWGVCVSVVRVGQVVEVGVRTSDATYKPVIVLPKGQG